MDTEGYMCADCSAKNPQWASVNRGVLLCDECSSIHRQLGRHVSQIKHLKKSRWRPSQLAMVQYLASSGANRFWEHILLEPMLSGSTHERTNDQQKHKKPSPNDPTHPTKADFIREKYLFLGFFKKPRNINQEDLNQQLHASVRTGVLETSLYLLALGANPNFIHPVKGTAPIHVACQYGQIGQVELLLAYGADVCIRDIHGKNAVDMALEKSSSLANALSSKENGSSHYTQKLHMAWSPMVDILVSAFYDLTDSLAYFLTRRVPNHKTALLGTGYSNSTPNSDSNPDFFKHYLPLSTTGVINGHFLVSVSVLHESNGTSNLEDLVAEARKKLSVLPSLAFEDLCIDVYDEADRRIINSFLENHESAINGKSLASNVNGMRKTTSESAPTPPPHKTAPSNRHLTLFFLPPNTAYSSIRNQSRQKLGRLSTVEFHTLVLDVLTEASSRLLPLFPPSELCQPVETVHANHSQYSTYLSSTIQPPVPINASSRNGPLPSPPLEQQDSDDRPETIVEDETETAGRLPCAQSSSSICISEPELNPTKQDSIEDKNSPTKSDSGKPTGCDPPNQVKHHLPDDPVYDQVAFEHELNLLSPSQTQNSSTNSKGPELVANSTSITVDTANTVLTSTSANKPTVSPSPGQHPKDENASPLSSPGSVHSTGQSSDSKVDSTGSIPAITSRRGQIPGSRRLHLSHTGRVAQNRASVPTLLTSGSCLIETTLPTLVEKSNEAFTSPINLQALINSSATGNQKLTSRETGTRSHPEPCCVAARNEVERLRKENSDLRTQLTELQNSKELVDHRLHDLEERMLQIDLVVNALKEENSALLAAFSAGMVMTHSPPNPSNGMTSDAQSKPQTNVPVSNKDGTTSDTKDVVINEEAEGDEDYEDHDAEYDMERLNDHSGGGNYAVGSQCLDSGVLLRQGIILRAMGSRGASPASAPTATHNLPVQSPPHAVSPFGASPANQQVNVMKRPSPPSASNVTSTSVFTNPTSYVNAPAVTVVSQQASPKSNIAATTSVDPNLHFRGPGNLASPHPHIPLSTPSDLPDDYTAPNTTGSPSPAPLPQVSSQFESPNESSISTSKSKNTQHAELQKKHAQILASLSSLPEYDSPPNPMKVKASVIMKTTNPKPQGPVDLVWPTPSSDRVVRCVETIIMRIRNLVEIANGDSEGNCVQCSRLIQGAVHDMLKLFPPFHQCPPRMAGALSDLASESQNLRLHCERNLSSNLGPTGVSSSSSSKQALIKTSTKSTSPEISTLIRHAHHIARAAKEVLSMFQRSE